MFLSWSNGDKRAKVVHASGESIEAAWQAVLSALTTGKQEDPISAKWLRIDWVVRVEAANWGQLRARLRRTKRNYFRLGVALDAAFEHAFLEQELNANAMLYGGGALDHAVVNEKNFRIYARARFGEALEIDFSDERQVFLFSTEGLFRDEDGTVHLLGGSGLDAGRRRIDRLGSDDVLALIRAGAGHLSRQVRDDGGFVYGYHPCFDRRIETYNTLRHASTTYAMIESWEVTHDDALRTAIDLSLKHLTQNLIRNTVLNDGTEAAFLIETGGEIKLGGNAVAILALTKHAEVTGSEDFLPLLERLALGIRSMQDPDSGSFVHVLHASDLTIKTRFRTIYYEGEAAFGLMRLYRLTGDRRWIAMVERAFDHFIASDHWQHHDHWLSYCVNELTRYRPEERYFRFGIRNVSGYLDFVLQRITTFPTLLELMMAARDMLMRIDARPEMHHLFGEIDLAKFRHALEFRAHYLLNGHFWPELAMYFRRPEAIAGSFFIRHHAFRVRIDDVEHYLSGFVAYLRYLEERPEFDRLVQRHGVAASPTVPAAGWSASEVESATGGVWSTPPPEGWTASGLCKYTPTMEPGNMVVMRTGEARIGILPLIIARLRPPPAAIIASNPDPAQCLGLPVLRVADAGEAILALGRHARSRMTGKIVGVTGSAGKTTAVAMLTHALAPFGQTRQTAHNANLPHGVAWNLASIPWDTPHVVLELAIGRMPQSARLARPHVALFTNILPAHLGSGRTLYAIARTKSAIFQGMSPADMAILNRDMLEWETVHERARQRGLTILHYGSAEECEFRLLSYEARTGEVCARVPGRSIRYRIGAAGLHMAMNSLAVLAAVSALGYPLEPALERLQTFYALPGRGETLEVRLGGRRLTVVDDAYNANPGSMRAALDRLSQEERSAGRRIAVLGEMADLGPNAEMFHTSLAASVEQLDIDRFYVMGDLYRRFWNALPSGRRGRHVGSLEELKRALGKELADGDVVLFKGSNSTRMYEMVSWIKESAIVR